MHRLRLAWVSAVLLSALVEALRCAEGAETPAQSRWAAILSPSAETEAVHWRFTTQPPAANSYEPQFVEDGWSDGMAGFGFRNPPGGVVRTPWSTPDLWLRRSFVIPNLDVVPRIAFWMNHDDAAEVYLNGVLACAAPNYTTAYHEFNITEESRKTLKAGTNFIAVHANQTVNAQYFDLGVMVRNQEVAPVVDTIRAAEWPQFLGPTRDGIYHGPALRETWPTEGPAVTWRMEVGEGYSSPVVGEGRLIVCHRVQNELVVDCLNPKTGRTHWSFREPMTFVDAVHNDNGPRATPSISHGRVFLCNSDGHLICLNLADGKKIWTRRLDQEFPQGGTHYGYVSSPLVTDQAVILQVGGDAASVVAFAPETGKVQWQSGDDEASAASPVLAALDGEPQIVVVTRAFVRGIEPAAGKDLWEYPTHPQDAQRLFAASPVIAGDDIFISGWFTLDARVLRVKKDGFRKLWGRNNSLSTLYANGIVHEHAIYGFHGEALGNRPASFRCVDLETGDHLWDSSVPIGTVIRTGGNLLILHGTGDLQIVQATRDGFRPKARAKVVGSFTPNYPAIADGYVYVKAGRELVCLDLRPVK